jgi:UDP-N-acetyl-D-glucosamine/UDP-N-acetyl-D-galactosamine dehydrogenase
VIHEYSIKTITEYPKENGYGAIILAVAHNEFLKIDLNVHKNKETVIYDVKGILEKEVADGRL